MHRIDLCLASTSFLPAYSGPAVRFTRYLPGFRMRGVRACVLTGTPDLSDAKTSEVVGRWQRRRTGSVLPVEVINGAPVYRVCLPENRFWRSVAYGRALSRFCRQADPRPDLVQLLALPLWSVPWLTQMRRLRIPMVYTHTMMGEPSPHLLKRALQRCYWRCPFQKVDCVVVSSDVMRRKLDDLGVTTRIEVIVNGADTSRFRPAVSGEERNALRRAHGIGARESVVLAVGPVTPRKGTDLLLEAWAGLASRFPNGHLFLVGPRHDLAYGFDEFRRKLEAAVAASGAPERVHFVGAVRNVEEYMRAADVFAFTSLREGMPNVVLEAMASGLPVLMTPFLGLPEEFGRPGEHYLLVERDPASLASAMARVLQSGDLREDLGQAARRWVVEHLDVEKSLDKYAALYADLVSRTGEKRVP